MNQLTKRLLSAGAASVIAVTGGYLVGPWEGKENYAYRDMVGVVTICYGQTKGVKMGDYMTDEQCEADLVKGLTEYNADMKKHVKVPLSEQEEAAYTSFIWNLGETNWRTSTMLKLLNQGKRDEACAQLLRWNKAGGKEVKGLTNRRKDEYQTCVGNKTDVNAALAELAKQGYDAIDIEIGESPPLIPTEIMPPTVIEPVSPVVVTPIESVPVTVCKWKIFNWCIIKG